MKPRQYCTSEPKKYKKLLYNVEFYKGLIPNPCYDLMIGDFHLHKGKWQFLQKNHAYIQWLFPNQHKSSFNYNSYALSPQQADIFRKNLTIGKNMILSYDVYTDFMGLKLINLRTGELKLTNPSLLHQVLEINKHNHLRLTRIIACLSITGFRHYALQLISFLEYAVSTPKYSHLSKIAQLKWLGYKSDEETVKICKLMTLEQIKQPHPVLFDKEIMEQLEYRLLKEK